MCVSGNRVAYGGATSTASLSKLSTSSEVNPPYHVWEGSAGTFITGGGGGVSGFDPQKRKTKTYVATRYMLTLYSIGLIDMVYDAWHGTERETRLRVFSFFILLTVFCARLGEILIRGMEWWGQGREIGDWRQGRSTRRDLEWEN